MTQLLQMTLALITGYRAAIGTVSGDVTISYQRFLEDGVLALGKDEWEKALLASNVASLNLLELAIDLRRQNDGFELSTPARDAALDLIRKSGNGKPTPSDEVRLRLSRLLDLIPASLRNLLVRDVVDDMMGLTDPAQITRLVEVAGDHVSLEEELDSERIVRRIFSPIVSSPTERSASWMANTVGRRLEFFRNLPEETKKEFGWRLKTALQNKDALAASITESLTNTAGLLDINHSPDEEEGLSSPPSEPAAAE
jgi:hypothetical protein